MNIYIKNMVCDRCILVVRQQLEKLELHYKNVQLGEVELAGTPNKEKLVDLREQLTKLGFELLDDKKAATVEKVKNIIIQLIHNPDEVDLAKKVSVILEESLQHDYHYITSLFTAVEGITIEKFISCNALKERRNY